MWCPCADASSIEVGGSLGGVQVVSLSEGAVHARVVSAGRLPPPHAHAAPAPAAPLAPLAPPSDADGDKALHFTISRKVQQPREDDGSGESYNKFSCCG